MHLLWFGVIAAVAWLAWLYLSPFRVVSQGRRRVPVSAPAHGPCTARSCRSTGRERARRRKSET